MPLRIVPIGPLLLDSTVASLNDDLRFPTALKALPGELTHPSLRLHLGREIREPIAVLLDQPRAAMRADDIPNSGHNTPPARGMAVRGPGFPQGNPTRSSGLLKKERRRSDPPPPVCSG